MFNTISQDHLTAPNKIRILKAHRYFLLSLIARKEGLTGKHQDANRATVNALEWAIDQCEQLWGVVTVRPEDVK